MRYFLDMQFLGALGVLPGKKNPKNSQISERAMKFYSFLERKFRYCPYPFRIPGHPGRTTVGKAETWTIYQKTILKTTKFFILYLGHRYPRINADNTFFQ